MSRIWAYLTITEREQFKHKAESMNMTEGELMQKLARLYLNTQGAPTTQINCLNCQYYQLATSQLMKVWKGVNDFFLIIDPTKTKK
ncbi:MAG: hypothetical protein WC325_09420 [Candidatus Bathyarchaeia archaeon]|jgi:hypothetical protein